MRVESQNRAPESVLVGTQGLTGEWLLPSQAVGVVMFFHGSSSRRQLARNAQVAQVLQRHGLGTLLFDLLSVEEAMQKDNDFNVELLTERVQDAVLWLRTFRIPSSTLPIGLFAAGTATAAALIAAARMPDQVRAVVSRSGRPDMANGYLPDVRAPTLLIVGAKDPYILHVNRNCTQSMSCLTALEVIPRATQYFEELGTLDAAANLAADWFCRHLCASEPSTKGKDFPLYQ